MGRRHIIHFSGGKDSTATWLYLSRELGLETLCIFCDTGHEAEETYAYISMLEEKHGLAVKRLTPQIRDLYKNVPERFDPLKPLTMELLCAIKKRFPSPTRRFCTEFLKIRPLQRWHSTLGISTDIIAVGIRADESSKRAMMAERCFDDFMQRDRWLPILNWTVDNVFDYHKHHGVPRNPLYDIGCSRVGCWPCIMARKGEIATLATKRPGAFQRLVEMERRVAAAAGKPIISFFSSNSIPAKYRTHTDPKSGKKFGDALDVWRWATSSTPRFQDDELFYDIAEEDMDVYELCDIYGVCE